MNAAIYGFLATLYTNNAKRTKEVDKSSEEILHTSSIGMYGMAGSQSMVLPLGTWSKMGESCH